MAYGRASASVARFCAARAISIAPVWIATMPQRSTMCGGLTIFTSSPYALCHQLSNGADVIMSNVPQMHTQAPRGPLNPQNLTVDCFSAGVPKKVVLSTSQPQESPV